MQWGIRLVTKAGDFDLVFMFFACFGWWPSQIQPHGNHDDGGGKHGGGGSGGHAGFDDIGGDDGDGGDGIGGGGDGGGRRDWLKVSRHSLYSILFTTTIAIITTVNQYLYLFPLKTSPLTLLIFIIWMLNTCGRIGFILTKRQKSWICTNLEKQTQQKKMQKWQQQQTCHKKLCDGGKKECKCGKHSKPNFFLHHIFSNIWYMSEEGLGWVGVGIGWDFKQETHVYNKSPPPTPLSVLHCAIILFSLFLEN